MNHMENFEPDRHPEETIYSWVNLAAFAVHCGYSQTAQFMSPPPSFYWFSDEQTKGSSAERSGKAFLKKNKKETFNNRWHAYHFFLEDEARLNEKVPGLYCTWDETKCCMCSVSAAAQCAWQQVVQARGKRSMKDSKEVLKKERNFISGKPLVLCVACVWIFWLHKYIHAHIITEDYEVMNVLHICTALIQNGTSLEANLI